MTEKERRKKWNEPVWTSEFFEEVKRDAYLKHKYYCPQCGARMEYDDGDEDYLVCPECGRLITTDDYYMGFNYTPSYIDPDDDSDL